MTPMIGAAIGFMMSDPTPVLHKIGTRAAITTLTVMSFGRKRNTDPEIVARRMSSSVISLPRPAAYRVPRADTTMTTPVWTATP